MDYKILGDMPELCKKCGFRRPIATTSHSTYWVCHYLLDTGQKRNSAAEHCNKYLPRKIHSKIFNEIKTKSYGRDGRKEK